MPGGVNKYLESLRWAARQIRESPVSVDALATRMMHEYSINAEYARLSVGFLKKVGFRRVRSGVCSLPDVMESWLRDGDPAPLIVILHNEVQFIGELLTALDVSTTTPELHRWANECYQMGWKSNNQVGLRAAWLRSAGLVELRDNRFLHRTDAGTAILDLIVVEPPLDGRHVSSPTPAEDTAPAARVQQHEEMAATKPAPDGKQASHQVGPIAQLADRIVSASTYTRNHEQFEEAVCEAFRFLGFHAEHLGGSGKTDVLLEARLGRDASYRVTIDAKTTSSPALQDKQVNWVPLNDHRAKHGADFSMLIGPNPSTRRLLERFQSQGVAVLSAKALAELCYRHAAAPLGLADYKTLFERGGEVDLAHVKKRSDEAGQRAALAKWLLAAIGEEAEDLGPRTARDLHGRHYRDEGADVATELEIQDVLHSLASALLGAIEGDSDRGYVLACSPTVTAERLRVLGDILFGR